MLWQNQNKNSCQKAPDIAALDCLLKVQQLVNATKSKKQIKLVSFEGYSSSINLLGYGGYALTRRMLGEE